MDDTQVRHIKAQLGTAIDSGDVRQMVSAICISLVSSIECQAHSNDRIKTIEETTEHIKDALPLIKPLDERITKLETRFEAFERARDAEINQRKGAGKAMKFLVGAGLVGGGVAAANLPQIIKALATLLGG